MALLTLNVDLKRVAVALESIAASLAAFLVRTETAPLRRPVRGSVKIDDLVDCRPSALVQRQDREAARLRAGLPAEQKVDLNFWYGDEKQEDAETRRKAVSDRPDRE